MGQNKSGDIAIMGPARRSLSRALVIGATLSGLLLAGPGHGAAAVADVITDPVFSIDYDPRQVHFDSVETKELLPACQRSLSPIKPLPPTLTLYAQHATASARIYVAGTAEDIGIYVIRDGRCQSGIAVLSLLQKHHNPPEPGDTPALSDAEVSGVFDDALTRYTRAFGGKKRFFEWLDTMTEEIRSHCTGRPDLCYPTYHRFPQPLLTSIERFRKE